LIAAAALSLGVARYTVKSRIAACVLPDEIESGGVAGVNLARSAARRALSSRMPGSAGSC
jgi:hypothetical protein